LNSARVYALDRKQGGSRMPQVNACRKFSQAHEKW
jgi:hypothetical protein